MAIGKVGKNGTLNENGTFYSVQDVNKLLENSEGGDLPTPTVADAGKAVVVDEEGKYALGEGGSGGDNLFIVNITADNEDLIADKPFSEILTAFSAGKIIFYSVMGVYALANVINESGGTINSIGACVVTVMGQGESSMLNVSQISVNSDNTVSTSDYLSN